MYRRSFLLFSVASPLVVASSDILWMCAARASEDETSKRVERVVNANGLAFRTVAWGPEGGPPVLALHGFSENADTWEQIARGLAIAGYRVVAFDQRGYSQGARPSDLRDYNFPEFVSDAIAVADAYDIRRFNLIGLGMGGAQSWIIAAQTPSRVISLVSLRFPHPAAFANTVRSDAEQAESWDKLHKAFGASTLEKNAASMLENDAAALRAFLSKSGLPEPWLSRYVKRLQQPGALVGAMSWERSVSLDEFAKVPAVAVPTLFLWSKALPLTSSTVQATGAYVTASYEVKEIDGAGNFMIETASDRILRSVLQFYDKTNARR